MSKLFELHLFLDPINPPPDRIDAFIEAVRVYNTEHPASKPMKACHLALLFREIGVVRVLQTAQYSFAENVEEAIAQIEKQAAFFAQRGWTVLRRKIEGIVSSLLLPKNAGILPIASTDVQDTRYFEFHLKIGALNADAAFEDLLELAQKFIAEHSTKHPFPIPLSWNCLKHKTPGDGKGHQVFFNFRPRGATWAEAQQRLETVKALICDANFTILEVHSEYIVHDTMPEMDKGWIDF